MGYPIYHSAYTAAQIEAAIGKGPKINSSGYWEVWNVSTGAYESTGVGAGVTPPTVVTQVADMTNHGYIYIYNGTETGYTAGYWYYWDGIAWTAGGAYQVAATDPTLTVAGAAADAQAAGDKLGELKSAITGVEDTIDPALLTVFDSVPVDSSAFVANKHISGGEIVDSTITHLIYNISVKSGYSVHFKDYGVYKYLIEYKSGSKWYPYVAAGAVWRTSDYLFAEDKTICILVRKILGGDVDATDLSTIQSIFDVFDTNHNVRTKTGDLYEDILDTQQMIAANTSDASAVRSFYQGSFSSAAAGSSITSIVINTNANRIRTINNNRYVQDALYFPANSSITLSVDSGYKYAVQIYDASTSVGLITFTTRTDPYTYSSSSPFYVACWVGKSDDSAITPSEGVHLHLIVSSQVKADIANIYRIIGLRQDVKFENRYIPSSALSLPSGFTQYPWGLHLTRYGSAYGYDFNVNARRKRTSGGITYYVSTEGDDGNTGLTPDDPLLTLSTAVGKADVETIIFLPGAYIKGTHWNFTDITKELNIIGQGNVVFDAGGNVEPLKITAACYIQNITFYRGNTNLRVTLDEEEIVFDNCLFIDSLSSNGLTVLGGHIIMYRCIVTGSYLDGFNYHKQSGYHAPKVLEIECSGYNCGNTSVSADSQNVSTAHDKSTRIVRIGCEYRSSKGTVVADADSAMSLNIALCASDTYGHDTPTRSGNYGAFSLAKMWLYDCASFGSESDIIADNASIYSTTTYENEQTLNDGTIERLT